jgi:hypothetical protein
MNGAGRPSSVKTQLGADKLNTLSRVGVETNNGVVDRGSHDGGSEVPRWIGYLSGQRRQTGSQ